MIPIKKTYSKIRDFFDKSKIAKWLVNLLFVASLAVVGFIVWHAFLFASFNIPSESMIPTVYPGDKVLVDKVTTGARLFNIFEAARGDSIKILRTYSF